ncbi:MAG TPA: class I SAM-dependent methyltransferase [Jiangellaceae bacterium]|nr:class I SAM-dependent methyltransferase [Jiangellaceae bacterium]
MSKPRVRHPFFARFYAWVSPSMERAGAAERRDALLAGLTGRVIDVGAGNGLNFAHYPPEVTDVLAVEPDPYLRALANSGAERAPIPIKVVDGVAEDLPADDESFDAGVASFVLCSVADLSQALRELHRAIRPEGQLRFFEHVRADTPGLRRVQRVLDATVWPALCGGDHTGRDTAAAIEDAGFTIQTLDRFRFPETPIPLPTSPHILGTAIK